MAATQKRTVQFKGKPLAILGHEIKVGDPAPDFQIIAGDLSKATLQTFKGKIKLISVVPSLDTPVCDQQTRRFNQEASKISDDVAVVTISMDLPFAQKRFCSTAGIDKVKVFSDHRDASFGLAYGVLIKDLRLLARSIFIIDSENQIRYVEYVKEVTDHPDYDAALKALQALSKK